MKICLKSGLHGDDKQNSIYSNGDLTLGSGHWYEVQTDPRYFDSKCLYKILPWT